MDMLDVRLNDAQGFDEAVHGTADQAALPSGSDLTVITKDAGTVSGRAVAVLTWSVEVDGRRRRAQYTVSIRHLRALLAIVNGAYDEDGRRRPLAPVTPAPPAALPAC